MGYTIAIAGKGGTGKTTIAGLIVRIIKENKLGSILAIDADPNSNLAEALGIEVKETMGSILEDISAHPDKIPSGMSKDRFMEYRLQTSIAEGEGFDVLVMGRPEGPGCYCYVNNVLRNIMARLIDNYDYIVIDNEAGLEHLSRRTSRYADALLVVSDATKVGLVCAKRINDLVRELDISIKKRFLIINRHNEDMRKEVIKDLECRSMPIDRHVEEILNSGLEYIGNIPVDNNIINLSMNGGSLLELDNHTVSLKALRKVADTIL